MQMNYDLIEQISSIHYENISTLEKISDVERAFANKIQSNKDEVFIELFSNNIFYKDFPSIIKNNLETKIKAPNTNEILKHLKTIISIKNHKLLLERVYITYLIMK